MSKQQEEDQFISYMETKSFIDTDLQKELLIIKLLEIIELVKLLTN